MFLTGKLTSFFIASITLLYLVSSAHAEEVNSLLLLEKRLKEEKGNVVYLDFWSSWCGPCRKSFPWMNELQNKYQQQGLTILSINLDHDRKLATQFLTKTPADFAIIYDPKGLVARKFKLKGMPSSFIFNRKGNLVSAHTGFNQQKSLAYEQEIIEFLSKTEKAQTP